jgi:acetamidase/formamidase
MVKTVCTFVIAALAGFAGWPAMAAGAPWAGAWEITVRFGSDSSSATMTLTQTGSAIEGNSGPLDENGYFPLTWKGSERGGTAELGAMLRGEKAGRLTLRRSAEGLTGEGTLYGVPVVVSGRRPSTPGAAPRTHDFSPTAFHLYYAGRNAPVLRIAPGDRVRTTTLDNEGQDDALHWRGMPGNTLTGPFYVEGAMPGDTLVVRIEGVRLTRDSAKMASATLNAKAVQGGYAQTPTPGWDRTWVLDRARGVARPRTPGDRLAGLELPLKPMIGSIGVAPPQNQALGAGDLGFHGGNLDDEAITAGATLYLPVFRQGALLSLGDGHALQGDGEVGGQGLETSLEVEFEVELIKGWTLGQVWSENAEFVRVSGIDNSLDTALQMATTGMARWLKRTYGLNDSEVATLLSAAVKYDIAEVVDPRPHVVAKLSKTVLGRLKPVSP